MSDTFEAPRIETNDSLPVGDVLFMCDPPKELTFSSFEELSEWYKQNPGRCVLIKNVEKPNQDALDAERSTSENSQG